MPRRRSRVRPPSSAPPSMPPRAPPCARLGCRAGEDSAARAVRRGRSGPGDGEQAARAGRGAHAAVRSPPGALPASHGASATPSCVAGPSCASPASTRQGEALPKRLSRLRAREPLVRSRGQFVANGSDAVRRAEREIESLVARPGVEGAHSLREHERCGGAPHESRCYRTPGHGDNAAPDVLADAGLRRKPPFEIAVSGLAGRAAARARCRRQASGTARPASRRSSRRRTVPQRPRFVRRPRPASRRTPRLRAGRRRAMLA